MPRHGDGKPHDLQRFAEGYERSLEPSHLGAALRHREACERRRHASLAPRCAAWRVEAHSAAEDTTYTRAGLAIFCVLLARAALKIRGCRECAQKTRVFRRTCCVIASAYKFVNASKHACFLGAPERMRRRERHARQK